PDLDGDNWGGVIFDAVNFEAIRQCGMFEVQRRDGDRPVRRRVFRTHERWEESQAKEKRGKRNSHEKHNRVAEFSAGANEIGFRIAPQGAAVYKPPFASQASNSDAEILSQNDDAKHVHAASID